MDSPAILFLIGLGVNVLTAAAFYVAPLEWRLLVFATGVVIGLGLIVAAGFFFLVNRKVKAHLGNTDHELYQDRSAMIAARGGLARELETTTGKLWVAFESGAHYTTLADDHLGKISRMILFHPESTAVKQSAVMSPVIADTTVPNIVATTKRAKAHGTQVKWSRTGILNVVIGEPNSPNGWARFQPFLPYCDASKWPSIVVRHNAAMFHRVKKAYEDLWEHSEDPKDLAGR